MTEPTVPAPQPGPADLRWQAFFRRSTDPIFVLDRRRRVLFVNAAWESLTATTALAARSLVCRRPRASEPDDSPEAILEHALTPPREVLDGHTARVRRLLIGRDSRRCWDVDFFPLRLAGPTHGLLILGRITPVSVAEIVAAAPLSESLIELRERATRRFGSDPPTDAGPALRLLSEQTRLAAAMTVPVLLVGEPGTGKQTLARRIHYNGPARERPFAALDCAWLPAAAIADVLFGDAAALGAIYLREPSHLPRDFQLRLCEQIHARGGEKDGRPVTRVLAGCSVDPLEEVRAGRLVDELHASLAVLTLSLPPLRERMGDLSSLVEQMMERANGEGGAHIKGIAADAWEVLRAHVWPGNLRELYAVLAAARRHARTSHITAADLPASLRLARRMEEAPAATRAPPLPLDALLEEAERRLMALAIRRAGGNKKRAADLLFDPTSADMAPLKALGLIDNETDAADEAGEEYVMRLPQIVVYEKDGRLKLQLEALAEQRRWALREARQPETCLSHLNQGGPAVVVIKAGRDPERELALLERATWLHPDAAVVVVADGDQPQWTGLAWDLGAAYVLVSPQPRERLPEIVAGLMGDKAEAKKA